MWSLKCPKAPVSEIPCGNQPFKVSKTLLKSVCQHFYANVPLTSNKLSCFSCLLVGSEILGALFNTLKAYQKYSFHNWQKLLHEVQTKLSSKTSTFSRSFIAFSKSTKFLAFWNKDHFHSFNMSEVIDLEKCHY